MKAILLTASLLSILSAGAHAQAMNHDAMEKMNPASSTGKAMGMASMTDGVVTKIDRTAGTVTLRHAEVKSVGMPAMTMAYKAKDPALLDKIAAGDKVAFSLEQQPDKKYLVDAIERRE